MTNAQAALLAAATLHAAPVVAVRDVKRTAAELKAWLDQTDAADKARIRVGD